MSCTCPTFVKSADPRREGTCARCARPAPDGVRASDPRVTEHFSRLKEMLRSAGAIASPPTPHPDYDHFQYMCLARIEKGAEEYGAANFRRRDVDLIAEACEETFDLCVYPLLEIVKNEPDPVDAVALGQAVYHAFLCYQNLLRYKAKVRGVSG